MLCEQNAYVCAHHITSWYTLTSIWIDQCMVLYPRSVGEKVYLVLRTVLGKYTEQPGRSPTPSNFGEIILIVPINSISNHFFAHLMKVWAEWKIIGIHQKAIFSQCTHGERLLWSSMKTNSHSRLLFLWARCDFEIWIGGAVVWLRNSQRETWICALSWCPDHCCLSNTCANKHIFPTVSKIINIFISELIFWDDIE